MEKPWTALVPLGNIVQITPYEYGLRERLMIDDKLDRWGFKMYTPMT